MKERFFEKKRAKNFYLSRLLSGQSLAAQGPGGGKVFWGFFSKKNRFHCAFKSRSHRSAREGAVCRWNAKTAATVT
jgi:hypothetical protein